MNLGLNLALGSVALGSRSSYAGHNPVVFDGADCLYQSAALFPDAAYGTIAIKFKPTSVASPTTQNLLHFGAANRRLNIAGGALLTFNGVFGATSIVNSDIAGGALVDGTNYTLQISWDGALDVASFTLNGSTSTSGWTVPGAQYLLSNANQFGIGGTGAGVVTNGFIGSISFVYIAAGATSAYNIDPALIYSGGDVDLSTIPGVTPQIFFGGTQTAANWNAGTNQGSAGGTFTMTNDGVV